MKFPSQVVAASRQSLHLLRRVGQASIKRLLTGTTGAVTVATAALVGSGSFAWAQEAATKAVEPSVNWWQAIVLGLVQGLTEFIPVSSSAHLNIVHHWMGQGRELSYDVFLSLGTVAAVAFYFRKDWKGLLTDPAERRLRNLVFLACVPAVIGGLVSRKYQETFLFADPRANAFMLVFAGLLLLLADKFSAKVRDMETADVKDSLIVGVAQAIALIPGVSRSGSTLTAGLLLGFKRADAARFSFLMSLPITLGACLYEFYGLWKKGFDTLNADPAAMGLGVLAAAISGFWAIGFLLNYLKTKDVTPFFIWRVVVALLVFALFRP